MRILVAAIGRARGGPEAALYDHYAARIQRWPFSLREMEPRRKPSGASASEAEGELLLSAMPQGAHVVALDETGRQMTSPDFATLLQTLQERACADLAFVIGGADGLSPPVRKRADTTLALGRATWPHLLVRGLLAEQIYRAQQILAGHPYHRA